MVFECLVTKACEELGEGHRGRQCGEMETAPMHAKTGGYVEGSRGVDGGSGTAGGVS
jgi:hypothetical protein